MDPKMKTNTYEFIDFSLVLTLSEWHWLGDRVNLLTENGLSVLVVWVTNSQTTALIA